MLTQVTSAMLTQEGGTGSMLSMILPFVLYAGIIPVVPLIGVEIFKRRKDQLRRDICYAPVSYTHLTLPTT